MRPDRADMAQGVGRLARVFEEALLEFGIDPGARDDAGAIMRPDLRLASLDDGVERGGIDIALLGQDRLERPHPKLQIGQLRDLARTVRVRMRMGMGIIGHSVASCGTVASLNQNRRSGEGRGPTDAPLLCAAAGLTGRAARVHYAGSALRTEPRP